MPSDVFDSEQKWGFTVVRSRNLHAMRPERSWRPIVTVSIDSRHSYECVLGCDGQNPNLKNVFELENVSLKSEVVVKVWHQAITKKKGRKRSLVASASHSIEHLLLQQHFEPTTAEFEIRLNCQNANKKNVSSRGKSNNVAHLHMKIRPPPNLQFPPQVREPETDTETKVSDSGTGSVTSDDPWPSEDKQDEDPHPADHTLRHRNVKGYSLDSDDDSCELLDSLDSKPFEDSSAIFNDEDGELLPGDEPSAIRHPPVGFVGWVAASLLPQYTEKIEVPNEFNWAERALASFTSYRELKEAAVESDYLSVYSRLQMEWTYVGGLLVALAAVDAAVFAISSDSMFEVSKYARYAVAASSVASGLGLASDAWFLLRYNWCGLQTFIYRARDVYKSYFFFCLSARVPIICMFLSALSLMSFLGLVAFEVWPQGVMATCFLIGVLLSLQFVVYGVHWTAGKVIEGGKVVHRTIKKP